MAFIESVKCSFDNAVDTISTITQAIVQKNRVSAQLNRLRLVMRNESEMINRAYVALGKHYYENAKSESKNSSFPNEQELFDVIENSKKRIQKARERYSQILENQTVATYNDIENATIEDITVACSNEDQYEESPFTSKEEDKTETKASENATSENTKSESEENFSF